VKRRERKIERRKLMDFYLDLVVRRCCTSDCGSPGNVEEYEGRTTYFCSSDECNGFGAEAVLTGGTGIIY
jgi:hypothetical protein